MDVKSFYCGLDIGTNEVGWAVTDSNYNVINVNHKDLWGVRSFDEAQTAAVTRLKRGSINRTRRREYRLDLLQELFAEEIQKVDPNFFLRLDNSRLFEEDKPKELSSRFTLFNDKYFKDKDFYKSYPTIFHLRKELVEKKEKADIRLVYLAIHHIIKHRGHFLMDGSLDKGISDNVSLLEDSFLAITEGLNELSSEEDNPISIDFERIKDEFLMALTECKGIKDKTAKFNELLNPNNSKQLKAICSLIAGGSADTKDIFINEDEYDTSKIMFSDDKYDETIYPQLVSELGETINIIDAAKAIYDYCVIFTLLGGRKYISEVLVDTYDKHKSDLRKLKELILNEYGYDTYIEMFKKNNIKGNYASYVKKNIHSGQKQYISSCNLKDFTDYVKKVLSSKKDTLSNDPRYQEIMKEIEEHEFLPKINSKDKQVIPYQLHLLELKQIIENQMPYYSFLSNSDEYGSVSDKIIDLLTFRVPYYVGHLSTYKNDKAWIVKRCQEKIYPWNFEHVVDLEASSEAFIKRMTNQCTYLPDCDVLPKNSLLYSEFTLLNEINKLRINGTQISPKDKNELVEKLFKTHKSVSLNQIKRYLVSQGRFSSVEEIEITGIDEKIKNSLSSYIDFTKILGKVDYSNIEMIENIIFWITIFNDSKMVEKKVSNTYHLEKNIIKQIKGLNYQGWGSLSKEFLHDDITCVDDLGEVHTIIGEMRETNHNLQEVLFDEKYHFIDKVNERRSQYMKNEVTIETLEEYRFSPAVRRSIWQTILLLKEISKIMKGTPKRIFVEVTRKEEEKKQEKSSRRKQIEELYKQAKLDKEELHKLQEELSKKSDMELRSDRLFFYFMQFGKCLYTGKSIDLDNIGNNDYYDIDHIIPRSKLKDDSLSNRCLVDAHINRDVKKDSYPLPMAIQKKMSAQWKYLKEINAIDVKKYNLLTRIEPLTDDELAEFINRQLVVTNQACKAVCELLKRIYPNSDIVYSKANNVTEFRDMFELYKCRDINDYHHAKDAYLNIVVGNVFFTRYGYNAKSMMKELRLDGESLNTKKIYNYPIKGAWTPNASLELVKKQYERNTMLMSRKVSTGKGAFYTEQLKSIEDKKTLVPLKENGPLANCKKYGGYFSESIAYYTIAEVVKKKGKVETLIVAIPIRIASQIKTKDDLKKFVCVQEETNNVSILLEKLYAKTLMNIDGYNLRLSKKTGSYNGYYTNEQAKASNDLCKKIKDLITVYEKAVKNDCQIEGTEYIYHQSKKDISKSIIISVSSNMAIYDYILNQMEKNIYPKDFYGKYIDFMHENRTKFEELPLKLQISQLVGLLPFIRSTASKPSLKILGLNSINDFIFSYKITDRKVKVFSQSVTGFYEKVIWTNIK